MSPELSALTPVSTLAPASVAAVVSSTGTTSAAPSPAAAPHASPISLLDPSTGLVVLEFYDAKGDETASLPTRHQLELYRRNEPSLDIFQPGIRDDSVPAPANTNTGLKRQV